MMNRRAVSAPYWSIRACGSTPLFFDFDIFSVPPMTTGRPSALQRGAGRAAAFVGDDVDVGRVDPQLLAAVEIAVEGRGDDHALGQQVGEGFAEIADQADIAHQLGEEARIQQMQDGVLDAADVLVDAALAPVLDALVDHGRGVVGQA